MLSIHPHSGTSSSLLNPSRTFQVHRRYDSHHLRHSFHSFISFKFITPLPHPTPSLLPTYLHLLLQLLLQLRIQLLQPLLIIRLHRPADAQPLGLVRLGNHVHVHVSDLLVRQLAVVLQDVEVRGARGDGQLLGDGQEFRQGVVGDVGQFQAVVFGDYELWGGGVSR